MNIEDLVGLEEQKAVARAVDAGLQFRVIHPGSMVTCDFRPNRLNIIVSDEGKVTKTRMG